MLPQKDLVRIAKKLKKNNVACDVVRRVLHAADHAVLDVQNYVWSTDIHT